MIGFREIFISGHNEAKSHRDHGTHNKCFYYFTLSYPPTIEWISIFNVLWGRHVSHLSPSLFAQANVEGQDLKLYCHCDSYLQLYLDTLKQDVATTNQKYVELLREREAKVKMSPEEDEEKRAMSEALGRLEF